MFLLFFISHALPVFFRTAAAATGKSSIIITTARASTTGNHAYPPRSNITPTTLLKAN